MSYDYRTCRECRHWHAEADAQQVAKSAAGGVVLAKPDPVALDERRGKCRAAPPSATTIQMHGQIAVAAAYPLLPPEFPACGLFTGRNDLGKCPRCKGTGRCRAPGASGTFACPMCQGRCQVPAPAGSVIAATGEMPAAAE
jgi:hypothetical protein